MDLNFRAHKIREMKLFLFFKEQSSYLTIPFGVYFENKLRFKIKDDTVAYIR